MKRLHSLRQISKSLRNPKKNWVNRPSTFKMNNTLSIFQCKRRNIVKRCVHHFIHICSRNGRKSTAQRSTWILRWIWLKRQRGETKPIVSCIYTVFMSYLCYVYISFVFFRLSVQQCERNISFEPKTYTKLQNHLAFHVSEVKGATYKSNFHQSFSIVCNFLVKQKFLLNPDVYRRHLHR